MTGETPKDVVYSPGMQAYINELTAAPATAFGCIHGGEYAIGIYDVPMGCAVFPDVTEQPLCPQHVLTYGAIDGMNLVIDLSEGGAWSAHTGEVPDFWIFRDDSSDELTLAEYPRAA